MTTLIDTPPVKKGDYVSWHGRDGVRYFGRVTAVRDLEYHVLGDNGIPYVLRQVRKERLDAPAPVTFNPLDVKRCKHCSALLQSGLQDTVHPQHDERCELYPDNAWKGYKLIKLPQEVS